MAGRKLRLEVVKADGRREPYIHTKVVGAIANALSAVGQADVIVAEELAEAVTYFLYRTGRTHGVESSEILSIVEAVLVSTGYDEAAAALSEHHYDRKLKRCRVEVVKGRLHELADMQNLYEIPSAPDRSKWDKSRIVEGLVNKHGLNRQTARTIASMVEEKVFAMGIRVAPASLIKQLVITDAAAILHAQRQLETV